MSVIVMDRLLPLVVLLYQTTHKIIRVGKITVRPPECEVFRQYVWLLNWTGTVLKCELMV